MVNHRTPVVHKSLVKEIRSRHYSTIHQAPRFTSTPTQIERSVPNASRYPLVEANFSDAASQPWIHDFFVKLEHGGKISRFRVFVKRGKALNPNACADTIVGDVVLMRVAAHNNSAVVNMRSTDWRLADYAFEGCLQRISRFQSAQRTRLPKELIVRRLRAFPG
ncbi:hypothetical protein C8R46DRAFT_1221070 [Mycena filopes]|nr:hypothetical protein C8R46DRAFT_1221070 [Mycena filopes]